MGNVSPTVRFFGVLLAWCATAVAADATAVEYTPWMSPAAGSVYPNGRYHGDSTSSNCVAYIPSDVRSNRDADVVMRGRMSDRPSYYQKRHVPPPDDYYYRGIDGGRRLFERRNIINPPINCPPDWKFGPDGECHEDFDAEQGAGTQDTMQPGGCPNGNAPRQGVC